ncbi:MAG: glycosyltransferase [Desulfobulbaceae bacterium]|nr:glycosyltransferase [Desulfobulbaceae bacterium]
MKVAYLSTFYPFRGGIAQFNQNLISEFAIHHETRAYTFTTQYPNFLFPGKSQFVENSDARPTIVADRILSTVNPLSYFTAASKINKFAPDILLTKFWIPFLAPSLGTTARFVGKSTTKIAILDNVIPHEKRIGDMALIKYFLSGFDAFVTMSESVRDDLLSFRPNANFVLTPHPLYDHFGEKLPKSDARTKLGINDDKKVLLFFGFIRKYKGLDLLIEAMSKLGEEYHLIIAGEPYESYSEYAEIISKHNLGSRVSEMIRFISDDDVRLLFSAADVCVLPYRSATQSGIVGISYHFDLPLIATNVGGLSEMIEPYQTGIMTEDVSANGVINAVKEYFSRDLKSMTENISKYKAEAKWSTLTQKIIQLYNQSKSKRQ